MTTVTCVLCGRRYRDRPIRSDLPRVRRVEGDTRIMVQPRLGVLSPTIIVPAGSWLCRGHHEPPRLATRENDR